MVFFFHCAVNQSGVGSLFFSFKRGFYPSLQMNSLDPLIVLKKINCSYQRLHSKCIMNITQLQKFQFHLFSLLQFSLSQVNK